MPAILLTHCVLFVGALVGLPALVFPYGNSREDGFPIGLQLISQFGDEEYLFDFAELFEEEVKKADKRGRGPL